MTFFSFGASFQLVGVAAILSTASIPSVILPSKMDEKEEFSMTKRVTITMDDGDVMKGEL